MAVSILWAVIGIFLLAQVKCDGEPQVSCTRDSLDVRVARRGVKGVALEKWGGVPGCAATEAEGAFEIHLELTLDLPCGTTRIRNKFTDDSIFEHKVSIVSTSGERRLFKVKCHVPAPQRDFQSNIVKRNVLPPLFVEPETIEITSEVTGRAPVPELSVAVNQNGVQIRDQVTVSPGAPLSMVVKLDKASSSIYGILVNYMMVMDTNDKNETIIFNGCTQDHYVFENFETEDGDTLTAKFRAFKFPESNYLIFKGTVDVCLGKCQGIRCSSGKLGYGRRRRRSVLGDDNDPNKIFEVTMKAFIKLDPQFEIRDPKSPFIHWGQSSKVGNPSVSYTSAPFIDYKKKDEKNKGSTPRSTRFLVASLCIALCMLS